MRLIQRAESMQMSAQSWHSPMQASINSLSLSVSVPIMSAEQRSQMEEQEKHASIQCCVDGVMVRCGHVKPRILHSLKIEC